MGIYKAYGLVFHSELDLPEFLPAEGKPDVVISYGEVPLHLDGAQQGLFYQAAPGKFLLHLKNIASYLVLEGNKIIIKPGKQASEKNIRVFLMASAIGALLQQRKLFTLHGSAVKINDKAVIFSGMSGIGKSTLAFSFLQQSFPVLTDDLSVLLTGNNRQVLLQPAYPNLKLWKDVLQKTGNKNDGLKKTRDTMEKYYYPFEQNFSDVPVPVCCIYELLQSNKPGFSIKELDGFSKFSSLKRNTYRFQFLKELGLTSEHFLQVNQFAEKIKVKQVSRPRDSFHLKELTSLILEDFKLLSRLV